MRIAAYPSLLLLAFLCGCAGSRHQVATPGRPAPGTRAVVISVDGAGNFLGQTQSLTEAVTRDDWPIHVRTFEWSHGYRRILADQIDFDHARRKGAELAEEVLRFRAGEGRGLPITLMGHSAGATVVLAAADHLPPNSVENIVLLAPSVSARYDLSQALRCASKGVEVFHSRRDSLYLGAAVRITGTSDGLRGPAAGRTGFCPPCLAPHEAPLLGKLRQHPWVPAIEWTGNTGGHFNTHSPLFLSAYVLPLVCEREHSR